MPDLSYELANGRQNGKIVCGVDEVGRGPLAGPVITAAVILPDDAGLAPFINKIRDSKKLSEKQRENLYPDLIQLCRYSIGEASVAEIDRLNILNATMLAMQRAVTGLNTTIDHVLVDGNKTPKFPYPSTAIIKGDGKCLSIAAASIIAKVTRDRLMKKLAEEFPGYGWEGNAGYGTATHMTALATLGITPWHRMSFAPVRVASLKKLS